jgi:nicotinate-nucleotide pyrophosphorylase (carboxylating)
MGSQAGRLSFTRALDRRLAAALREDGAFHDVTTLACVPVGSRAEGVLVAKAPGVLAGLPVAARLFALLDRRCRLVPLVREGARVRPGLAVARVSGPMRALLSAERTALNLLSRLSGVATLTRRMALRTGPGRLYDTRKTTPLWRDLERYAVRVGGGVNHRFNLSSQVLIKDNHIALAGGVGRALAAARRRAGRGAVIEVEVEDLAQAREALEGGADILLVDNAAPALVRKILRWTRGKALVEVSGGLDERNIGHYARSGVHRLSSGALTHSARSLDFSLDLHPA